MLSYKPYLGATFRYIDQDAFKVGTAEVRSGLQSGEHASTGHPLKLFLTDVLENKNNRILIVT